MGPLRRWSGRGPDDRVLDALLAGALALLAIAAVGWWFARDAGSGGSSRPHTRVEGATRSRALGAPMPSIRGVVPPLALAAPPAVPPAPPAGGLPVGRAPLVPIDLRTGAVLVPTTRPGGGGSIAGPQTTGSGGGTGGTAPTSTTGLVDSTTSTLGSTTTTEPATTTTDVTSTTEPPTTEPPTTTSSPPTPPLTDPTTVTTGHGRGPSRPGGPNH